MRQRAWNSLRGTRFTLIVFCAPILWCGFTNGNADLSLGTISQSTRWQMAIRQRSVEALQLSLLYVPVAPEGNIQLWPEAIRHGAGVVNLLSIHDGTRKGAALRLRLSLLNIARVRWASSTSESQLPTRQVFSLNRWLPLISHFPPYSSRKD